MPLDAFNPTELDCEQWIKTIKEAEPNMPFLSASITTALLTGRPNTLIIPWQTHPGKMARAMLQENL